MGRKNNQIFCMSCGAPLDSFVTHCPYCGREIRDMSSSKTVEEFSKELMSYIGKGMKGEKLASYIKNYPVPNSKEDLLEFMILATSNIDLKKLNTTVQQAWIKKMDQIYKKAKLSIKKEEDLKPIEDIYQNTNRDIKRTILNQKIEPILLIFFPFIITGLFSMIFLLNNIYLSISSGIFLLLLVLLVLYLLQGRYIESITKHKKKIYVIGLLLLITSVVMLIIGLNYNPDHDINYRNYYDENVEKYDININIDFDGNIIFNRYDVELLIYDQKEIIEHGKDKKIKIRLPKGEHKLKFKSVDENITTEIKLVVKGNTDVTYKISCNSDEIKVKETSIRYNE